MICYLKLSAAVLSMAPICVSMAEHDTDGRFRALAAAILATLDEPARPVTGKCVDCNGTGKTGDGTVSVKCLTCNGTGRNPRKAAQPPLSAYSAARARHMQTGEPLLLMISSPRCAFCELNFRQVIQPLQANGALKAAVFCRVDESADAVLCKRLRQAAGAGPRALTPAYIVFHRDKNGRREAKFHTGSITRTQLLAMIQ